MLVLGRGLGPILQEMVVEVVEVPVVLVVLLGVVLVRDGARPPGGDLQPTGQPSWVTQPHNKIQPMKKIINDKIWLNPEEDEVGDPPVGSVGGCPVSRKEESWS